MAFFPDLSPYTYFGNEPAGTVNVGWLDAGRPFPTEKTSDEFRDRLRWFCDRPVQQTRGFHPCPFCPGRWQDKPRGSAEIRVPGVGPVYASPTLIHHYVVAHDYHPPDEFVAAVLAAEAGPVG